MNKEIFDKIEPQTLAFATMGMMVLQEILEEYIGPNFPQEVVGTEKGRKILLEMRRMTDMGEDPKLKDMPLEVFGMITIQLLDRELRSICKLVMSEVDESSNSLVETFNNATSEGGTQ